MQITTETYLKNRLEKNYKGFTIHPETLKTNPKIGFMVGGLTPSTTTKHHELSKTLTIFVRDNQNKGAYLGTWKDSDTGLIWLDVSSHIKNKKEAVQIAKERKEIAIWDCANEKEIRINY